MDTGQRYPAPRRGSETGASPRSCNPLRTAIGLGFFAWVFLVFFAGSADRILVSVGFSYTGQVAVYRWVVVIAPLLVALITHRICRELRDTGGLRTRRIVRRTPAGGYAMVDVHDAPPPPSAPPLGTDPAAPSRTRLGEFR